MAILVENVAGQPVSLNLGQPQRASTPPCWVNLHFSQVNLKLISKLKQLSSHQFFLQIYWHIIYKEKTLRFSSIYCRVYRLILDAVGFLVISLSLSVSWLRGSDLLSLILRQNFPKNLDNPLFKNFPSKL